jgi:cell division inhibitor SepF
MSGFTQAVRNLWRQGEDEDYAHDDEADTNDSHDIGEQNPPPHRSHSGGSGGSSYSGGGYGGGSLNSGRRLRPVPSPLRSREKNIYTLKPKSQADATIAADYLKTGAAVVVNLEEVDRVNAIRIIDFMSGVCYGLEGPGHAMKLGDAIFLYTPAEFEISSDETDYGENPEFFFRELTPSTNSTGTPPPAPQSPPASSAVVPPTSSYQASERRSWER